MPRVQRRRDEGESSFAFSSNAPASTDIYTLSLHDALPISSRSIVGLRTWRTLFPRLLCRSRFVSSAFLRSEEHTSELQSQSNLVCRLLLEKKNSGRERIDWHAAEQAPRPHHDVWRHEYDLH